jgi:hypothetical protein
MAKKVQWQRNIPTGRKISQYFQFKGPPKFTQIGTYLVRKYTSSGNPGN